MGAVVALLVGAGCYDVPTPDCGFACGPAEACPADYTCSALDNRCHRDGAAPDLVCPAATPIDPGAAPTVVDVWPRADELFVPTSTAVFAYFSEPVSLVSGATFQLIDDVTLEPVLGVVSYDGESMSATFGPSAPLAVDTRYRITLTSTIVDHQGSPLVDAPFSWVFTTLADPPPLVTLQVPAPNQTDIPVGASVVVGFSEQVFGVAGAITLTPIGGAPVAGALTYDPVQFTATFAPDQPLAAGTTHEVRVTDAITDVDGNPLLDAPFSWSFTTFQDVTPPSFVASGPMPGDTDVVPSDIRVAFDEEITNAAATSVLVSTGGPPISGVVTTGVGGLQVVFTPDAALPAGATIDVTLTTAITDRASNPLVAPVMFSFTTAP